MGASRREAGRRANESPRLVQLIRPFYLISLIANTLILALLIIAISPLDRRGECVHYIGRFWSLINVHLSGTRMYIRGKEKIKKVL